MLKTHYDLQILKDFVKSKPDPFDNPRKMKIWVDYLNYLKSGTHLMLYGDIEKEQDSSLLSLTTGRGESKIIVSNKFKDYYKQVLPKSTCKHEAFFLDITDEKIQNNYRIKNNYHFSFQNDHFEGFEKLSLCRKAASINVQKNKDEHTFHSWSQLENYILPFTDVIITDKYLLSDESLISANIEQILIQLDKAVNTSYNFLLVTLKGKRNHQNAKYYYNILKKIKKKYNLKARIGVASTNYSDEHDRNIFMTYLRIYSGDSLNYIKTDGKIISNTSLTFFPYTNPDNYQNAEGILQRFREKILPILKDEEQFQGNPKNRLLDL